MQRSDEARWCGCMRGRSACSANDALSLSGLPKSANRLAPLAAGSLRCANPNAEIHPSSAQTAAVCLRATPPSSDQQRRNARRVRRRRSHSGAASRCPRRALSSDSRPQDRSRCQDGGKPRRGRPSSWCKAWTGRLLPKQKMSRPPNQRPRRSSQPAQ
eukprot:scaffold98229_cov76-Phaeocystis_antarctica.AAC.2